MHSFPAFASVFFSLLCWCATGNLSAQTTAPRKEQPCQLSADEFDEFDSLHTIASKPVDMGYFIPSLFETADGPKMIGEAKAMVTFTQNDSIDCFFLNLILPEYKLQTIAQGFNVMAILDDTTVVGFLNFPDEGFFDKSILMRTYQHSCVVPLDLYYRLAHQKITKIRVEYARHRRTITLSEEQQTALRRAFQCVGKAAGLYPIKP